MLTLGKNLLYILINAVALITLTYLISVLFIQMDWVNFGGHGFGAAAFIFEVGGIVLLLSLGISIFVLKKKLSTYKYGIVVHAIPALMGLMYIGYIFMYAF